MASTLKNSTVTTSGKVHSVYVFGVALFASKSCCEKHQTIGMEIIFGALATENETTFNKNLIVPNGESYFHCMNTQKVHK